MKVQKVTAIILDRKDGTLTPNLCQVCKKSGPGMVVVRGLNGRRFSAHAWPCAEREGLRIDTHDATDGIFLSW